MKRLIAVLLFSAALWAQPLPVVIRGARVVDGTGAPARILTVVIRGGKIEAVAPDAAAPAGARVIDAAGQTLMPGLFDLHTHLSASAASGLSGDWGKSDDIERGGRTALGTLRVNGTDSGVDHSSMLMLPVVRAGGDHALLVVAQLADKDRPYVRVEFPLTPGGVSPADACCAGISFDMRGEAVGRLLVQTFHVRNNDAYAAPFIPGAEWQTVKIPFTSLQRRAANTGSWDGKDARALLFELAGTAGSSVWLELDNVRFY